MISPFPEDERIKYEIPFGAQTLAVDFTQEDRHTLNEIFIREKNILMQYSKFTPEAMERFYRICYRASYMRMKRFSDMLTSYFRDKRFSDKEKYAYIYKALYSFPTTELNNTDIIMTPLDTLLWGTGDCDSKSLLAAILLHQQGIANCLMVSYAYQHAGIGVLSDFVNSKQTIFNKKYNEKEYFFVELLHNSSGASLKNMSDAGKWNIISLYPYGN
jgi:hypothetical protein